MSAPKIGLYTATSIVIANMIGTGVFTSLGFQAAGLHSGTAILLLWALGGVAALAGAFSYGELGAMFPRSGGEYQYLSRIYHPSVGFMSGWVSATVGFAAPVAAAAIALGEYLQGVFPALHVKVIAVTVVTAISLIHAASIRLGSRFQNIFTTVKVIMILFIIICGLFSGHKGDIPFSGGEVLTADLGSTAFVTSFFFVSLAYSGWNAAGYIASEIKDVQINLPKSLFLGTAVVTLLYMTINFIFMYVTPLSQMSGPEGPVVDIAGVAAGAIFGAAGGKVMGLIISVLLLSTVSAMTMAGPRVIHTMGEDNKLFSFFGRRTAAGTPAAAIFAQCLISLVFIFTSTFQSVVVYISFSLSLFTFLTVLGLFIMRYREPDAERPYKAWGYPVMPAIFLLISIWLMYFGFKSNTTESLYGLGTSLLGLVIYFLTRNRK